MLSGLAFGRKPGRDRPFIFNSFRGLDLIDIAPKELWTEVRYIVQEAGIKTMPKKKKCKKAKWLSKEGLQRAEQRREAKG